MADTGFQILAFILFLLGYASLFVAFGSPVWLEGGAYVNRFRKFINRYILKIILKEAIQ